MLTVTTSWSSCQAAVLSGHTSPNWIVIPATAPGSSGVSIAGTRTNKKIKGKSGLRGSCTIVGRQRSTCSPSLRGRAQLSHHIWLSNQPFDLQQKSVFQFESDWSLSLSGEINRHINQKENQVPIGIICELASKVRRSAVKLWFFCLKPANPWSSTG